MGSSGFFIEFHTWPVEPFTKKNGSIKKHFGIPYMKRGMEPFLVLNRTIEPRVHPHKKKWKTIYRCHDGV